MNFYTMGLISTHMATLHHQVKGEELQVWKPWWKETIVGVTCWELESHLFKALVLQTFHICHWNLGRWLEKLLLEGFQEGHEDTFDVSRQRAFFDNLTNSIG